MKNIILKFLLVCAVFPIISSCDSGEPENNSDGDGLAQIVPQIIAGEVFTFTSQDPSIAENLIELRFTGTNEATVGTGIVYDYFLTGETTADIQLVIDPETPVNVAVQLLLSDQLGAALSAEFRQILTRATSDDFTNVEVARIVEILNVAGAGLIVDPNDDTEILAPTVLTYQVRSTSSVAERFIGIMGGVYTLSGVSREVAFSEGTITAVGFTSTIFVPFVTGITTEVERFEAGIFSLQLVNDSVITQ